jgi:proton glutamate symport protein
MFVMKLPRLQLYTKVLIGLLCGAVFGSLANHYGFAGFIFTYIKPFGTLFVRLIGMVVVPLVFASLVVGTASLDDVRKLGRIGAKTLIFYTCTTVIAICIGLLLANAIRPGVGLSDKMRAQLEQQGQSVASERTVVLETKPSLKDVLLDIVPRNPFAAFVEGKMLQVIFFALLFGICLTLIPARQSQPVTSFLEGVNEVMIQIVHLVMRLAPYGVFALISAVIADFGSSVLLILIKYAATVVVGLTLHTVLVYSVAIWALSKSRISSFFKGIRPAQLIAFSSSSSSATLPVTIECAEENLGVSKQVSSFVLPLGATINMDGTALYQGVSALFIAQVYGMDLSIAQQLTIVMTATLASVGTSGTPGAAIVTLAIVLKSIGIPMEGIGLIIGVERLLDMCRSVVNITGDACCAVVVSSSENKPQDTLCS